MNKTWKTFLNDSKDYDLSSFIVKKELNPKFWSENNELEPKIREKLLEIAEDFFNSLEIEGIELEDITSGMMKDMESVMDKLVESGGASQSKGLFRGEDMLKVGYNAFYMTDIKHVLSLAAGYASWDIMQKQFKKNGLNQYGEKPDA